MASVGDLPLPQGSPPSNKRERDSDSPISSATSDHTSTPPPLADGSRTLAGSKRVNKETSGPGGGGVSGGSIPLKRSQPREQPHNVPILQQPPTVPSQDVPDSLMLDSSSPSSATLPQQQQQELYTLPMYSDELGRIPLHGQIKFSPHAQAPPASSHPHHSHALGGHLHQHIPNHQPVDPGGLWYSFEQAQMRGLQDFGMVPNPSLMGPGGRSGLGGDVAGSQAEADYIFNQLAMGYPAAPYPPDMQSGHMPQTLSGMGMGVGMLGGGGGMRGNEMMQSRYGLDTDSATASGSGLGGQGDDAERQQQRQHGYLDSDTMAMWSAAPRGFE